MRKGIILIILVGIFFSGCSGGSMTQPNDEPGAPRETVAAHQLWGLYRFEADMESRTLDVIPIRTSETHLNALPFLEPPALVNLTLDSLQFNGNIIEADIGLRHPFLGLTEFTGFDVCGVLISDGSIAGFTDPDILLPGDGDVRLLNPDGFTRWWNPVEFPVNTGTIFGYNDGLLGTPDSAANFTSTLNGYKYYCDELDDPGAPLSDVDPSGRGVFSAGAKNVRHFTIHMGDGAFAFNYAVDASWRYPTGGQPWTAPDDFAPDANRPEAWNITVHTVENTLWNDGVDSGGALEISVDVYDWFNAELNIISVESPGNFAPASGITPSGGGIGYSTYAVEIISATPSPDAIDILVTAECESSGYGGLLPGKTQAAYMMFAIPVAEENPTVPADLILEDEVVIQPMVAGHHQQFPAICREVDDEMVIAYIEWWEEPGPPVFYRSQSMGVKSVDSGDNWDDWDYGFTTNYYDIIFGDTVKIWPAIGTLHNGCWMTANHWYFDADPLQFWYGYCNSLFYSPFTNDHAHYANDPPDYNQEILQDADRYVHVLSDGQGSVGFKRSILPDRLYGEVVPNGFEYVPEYIISDPGRLSRVRSTALYDDVAYVAFFDQTANTIKLAHNTSDWQVWDATTVVWDGDASGTSDAHDPGLYIDEGGYHVTFIRTVDASGDYQLCYTHSTDMASWSNPVVIRQSAVELRDNPVYRYVLDGTPVLCVIWWEVDDIYAAISTSGGASWTEPIVISGALDENGYTDFMVTPDDKWHIAFCSYNPSSSLWELHYRRGYVELE